MSDRTSPRLRDDAFVGTIETARLLNVSPATVQRWIDAGSIPCTRTLGGHRRILLADLKRFLSKYGYAQASQPKAVRRRMLFVGRNIPYIRELGRLIQKQYSDVSVDVVDSAIVALLSLGRNPPDVMVLHGDIPAMNRLEFVRVINREKRLRNVNIAVIGREGPANKKMLAAGAKAVYPAHENPKNQFRAMIDLFAALPQRQKKKRS